jgi:hypothetical protein
MIFEIQVTLQIFERIRVSIGPGIFSFSFRSTCKQFDFDRRDVFVDDNGSPGCG